MEQKGFTLIEMIVVILLLAILSVVAVPRFINLSDEAKAAAVQGVASEISAEAKINFAGYQLSGVFDFGSSTPATSTKVVSTSVPAGENYGSCELIVRNLFPNVVAGQNLPGGMSISSDGSCQIGTSVGVTASCRIYNVSNTMISAPAYVPCTN